MIQINRLTRRIALMLGLALSAAGAAQAAGEVGTTFPTGFTPPNDASLGVAVIGFGGAGPVQRTPVIFLHGNGGTPYSDATTCASFGANIRGMAQHFADNGYNLSELWALGYQGTQCEADPVSGFMVPAYNSSLAHTHAANVPDLRVFVAAVMRYTGAGEVDIVAHGMGVTLAREWVRQDRARKLVRKFVAIEGPNQGTLICSPANDNHWKLAFSGGFTPNSPVCQEIGSPNTPFLKLLNKAVDGNRITPSDVLVIRNGDASFLFMPWADGLVAGVPSIDSYAVPTDFTYSASIRGGQEITLTGQHGYDTTLGTAHVGIANSPITWQAAMTFLAKR